MFLRLLVFTGWVVFVALVFVFLCLRLGLFFIYCVWCVLWLVCFGVCWFLPLFLVLFRALFAFGWSWLFFVYAYIDI